MHWANVRWHVAGHRLEYRIGFTVRWIVFECDSVPQVTPTGWLWLVVGPLGPNPTDIEDAYWCVRLVDTMRQCPIVRATVLSELYMHAEQIRKGGTKWQNKQ